MNYPLPVKTLNDAIKNGIREAIELPACRLIDAPGVDIIHRHIRAFLAERFSTVTLNPNLEIAQIGHALFKEIVGHE